MVMLSTLCSDAGQDWIAKTAHAMPPLPFKPMTLTFQTNQQKVEISISDEADLSEFVEACRAGAFAFGYSIEAILDCFTTTEELDALETLMDDEL